MSIADIIHQKITEGLAPVRLEITDDSAKHRGHSGAPAHGESHFHLLIVSTSFEGMSAVARHRLVNRILADELRSPIHALSLTLFTPEEMNKRSA